MGSNEVWGAKVNPTEESGSQTDGPTLVDRNTQTRQAHVQHRETQTERGDLLTQMRYHREELERIERELRELEDDTLCIVCMGQKKAVLFMNCSHMVTCKICSGKVEKCPKCREPIKKKVDVIQ